MNVLLLHLKRLALVFLFIIALACVGSLVGCEPQTAALPAEAVPAQENFYQEKIWTEADFRAAEVDELATDYTQTALHLPPPDNVTEEDITLIKAHQAKQLQRLTAGVNK